MSSLACPPPFLNAADYPFSGGQNASRLCSSIGGSAVCCLPCPLTDWVYPENFAAVSIGAEWLALASVVCCVFMLLSFLILPVNRTSRHYLSVCLVTAIGFLTLCFIVPLAGQPNQCHDAITPNDMRSDTACAFSGSFVLFGGAASVIWIFIRSLSLHLQICWQITPGKKFFWLSLLGGWGVAFLLYGLALGLSGVSYRFGLVCHVNHDNSIATFWGPVLAFTGCAAVLQFITLAYCIRVYLRSLMDAGTTSVMSSRAQSSAMPSFAGSIKTVSTRAAYRRVRKVISMQWRGIMVVLILVASATYFAIIFIKLDHATVASTADPTTAIAWVECLALNPDNKDACLGKIGNLVVGEPAVAGVLYLIASMGIWCILFLGRIAMFKGWWDLIKRPFSRDSDNWVSADARRLSDPRNYEMLTGPPQQYYMGKTPEGGLVAMPAMPGMPTPEQAYSPSGMAKEIDFGNPRAFSPPVPTKTPPIDDGFNQRPRAGSRNFSHPRPTRSDSQTNGRVNYSREGTHQPAAPSSPLSSSPEFHTPRAFATPYGHPGHASSIYSHQQEQGDRDYFTNTSRRRDAERERGGSALGNRSGSAMSRERPTGVYRSGSVLSSGSARDWDPRTTFAKGGAGGHGREGALSPGR